LDALIKTKELIREIADADQETLHRLIIQFEDQVLLHKLMLELAKAKQENSKEYFDYLVDHYFKRKFPQKLSVKDIDFINNQEDLPTKLVENAWSRQFFQFPRLFIFQAPIHLIKQLPI